MLQLPLIALFIISFAIALAALAATKFRTQFLCLLLVLIGWTNLVFRTVVLSPADLRNVLADKPEIVSVRGVLKQTPQIRISERNGEESERSRAKFSVSDICRDHKWQRASGDIIVSTPAPLTNFFAGESFEIVGVIARPSLPLAEGLFNEREYLKQRGIYFELKTSGASDWQMREPFAGKMLLTDRFLNRSKHTLAIGLKEDEILRLLWAMTLGWRTAFTGDVGDPFLRAGTMHMFAIDGLRIALISGMLVALLRVLRLSRAWCGAIAIPAIWFYTAATGWEASAIRASVMMTIILGGWALKRPSNLLNSLAAAALLILLWDPRQLFEASFQLSFFVMLTIALLLPKLNNYTDKLLQHDPLLPDDLLPEWRKMLIQTGRIFGRYLSLSIAAWLGSIPLSALYFHLFSPVSPLANLIAVPLGTLALMANLGALICGDWLTSLTDLFNNAAWFFMWAMQWVSVESTKIPWSYIYVPSPSWISVGIYYVILIVALSGGLNTVRRKIVAGSILVLIAGVYLWRWEDSWGEIQATVLPLNGGHAIYVDAAGTKDDLLIDCGNRNAVDFTLKNYLRAQGVNVIPNLVLSDAETRNCGGAELLNELFPVREFWTSPIQFRSKVYNDAVAALGSTSMRKQVSNGDEVDRWKVLWPNEADRFTRADDGVVVLQGTLPGVKMLLLSDLSRAGQSGLLSKTNDLHADIVVAGLPNGEEPLVDTLLTAVQPRVIVIADSDFPASRRANARLKERLAQTKLPVFYTRDCGAIRIIAGKAGWKLQTVEGNIFSNLAP